jgi:2-oxoglutarate dehydrogenase complex dihydrolipoamide succinyltransferase (E2) component
VIYCARSRASKLSREFKLPDLGEGVAEGEIVKWLVKEGDPINEDQPMVEVMTDKATVQIPSPAKGKVGKILTKEGQTAKVGDVLVTLDEVNGSSTNREVPQKSIQQATPVIATSSIPVGAAARPAGIGIVATPATRKLARDLNLNIESVVGSGPAGRITEEDVRKAAGAKSSRPYLEQPRIRQPAISQQIISQSNVTTTTSGSVAQVTSSGKEAGQMEERIPIHGIRKRIAEKMSKSLRTTAQVTHVDEVDFSQLTALREKVKPLAEQQNVKLTFMPFIMQAVVACLKEFPYFNASIDDERQEIVLKHYYNIGFATDTPNGLIVPVIKDLDRKSLFQIARELGDLSEKARAGKIALEEIQGGTFTVTNVGALGGTMSTPIINAPEVAILGVQRIQKRPVVRDDQIVIREMSYVSLSFDHRIVDGADAARFTTKLISILENPGLLMATGVHLF